MKRFLLAFALLFVLAIVSLFVFLRNEHESDIALPAPTGPHNVGRTIERWTDGKRELLAWIWYPSAVAYGPRNEYIPARMRGTSGRGNILTLLTRDPSKVRVHSRRNPAVCTLQPTYPVVLLRGGASAEVVKYSTLAEDLASHGYVVVGIDAPYRTGVVAFPDGRVIYRTDQNNLELVPEAERRRRAETLLTAWTSDMSFAVDQLTKMNASGRFAGRLDLARIGAFGHSFGGAQAAQFCHDDPRCKAGVDIDGMLFGSVARTGVGRPFLFLLSDHGRESDPESARIMATVRAVPGEHITIPGATHFTFSDDAVLKSQVLLGLLRVFGGLRIDPREQLAMTTSYVCGFFDRQFKNESAPPATAPPPS